MFTIFNVFAINTFFLANNSNMLLSILIISTIVGVLGVIFLVGITNGKFDVLIMIGMLAIVVLPTIIWYLYFLDKQEKEVEKVSSIVTSAMDEKYNFVSITPYNLLSNWNANYASSILGLNDYDAVMNVELPDGIETQWIVEYDLEKEEVFAKPVPVKDEPVITNPEDYLIEDSE